MANEAERALRHAVRSRVVLRYVGELGLVLGLMALIPFLGAVVFREWSLLVPYGAGAAFGIGFGLLARRVSPAREIQPNEALSITVLVFLLSPLVMAGSLVFQGIPWLDAIFEAISGVTTTGLSTLASVETRPHTFLLARAWMQWVGGLGFVVLSLALILAPGVATRRLGTPSLSPAEFVGSMRVHARRVLWIYVSLTGIGIVVLLAFGADPFDAIVHTLAGISTGGFAPRDSSLAALGRPLQAAILGVSILGAISLPLYASLRRLDLRHFLRDREMRALFVCMALVAIGLVAIDAVEGRTDEFSATDMALLAVSAQTTTGFATTPLEDLPASSKALVVVAMLTGGSEGSTAGGCKLLRVLLMVRLVLWLIAQTRLPPHAVSGPTLGGEPLESSELLRAGAMILLFGAVVVASWIPFLVYGYAPIDALFEVSSATGTVGLSVGIARPDLEPVLKGVLCFDMLLGRLEIFAVLVFLAPRTWIGRRATT